MPSGHTVVAKDYLGTTIAVVISSASACLWPIVWTNLAKFCHFGEIFLSVWQCFQGYVNIWQKYLMYFGKLFCNWANVYSCKLAKCCTTDLCIWSHCSMPIDVLQMKKLNNSTTTLKFLSKNLKNVLLYLANRKNKKIHTQKQFEILKNRLK